MLLLCAPGRTSADDLVAAHLAVLHDTQDARVAAALDRIESLGPRLLAARSYLRSAARLPERWSWTQEQIDAYPGSPAQVALDAEIARVREIFEAGNPGYTLFVNPQVRSLDIQLQRWNENRSVADAGNHLLETLRAIVGTEGFPAPGLSPHGQMHAVDFQVRQGALTIAGPGTSQVQTVWVDQGWRDRLESAVRRASDKFRGPLQNPDEPWQYDYHP